MPKTSNLLIKVALHSYPRKPKPLPTAEARLQIFLCKPLKAA